MARNRGTWTPSPSMTGISMLPAGTRRRTVAGVDDTPGAGVGVNGRPGRRAGAWPGAQPAAVLCGLSAVPDGPERVNTTTAIARPIVATSMATTAAHWIAL